MNVQMDGVTIVQQAVKSLMDENLSTSEASIIVALLSRDLEESVRSHIQSTILDWVGHSQDHIFWLLQHNIGKIDMSKEYTQSEIHVSTLANGGAIFSR